MSRFWLATAVLIAVDFATPDSVNADGALKHVEISEGINPKRRIGIPGTIERGYSWKFENQNYTALIAIDTKWYNKIRSYKREGQDLWSSFYLYIPLMVREGTNALQDLVRGFNQVMPSKWSAERKVNFVLAFVHALPYTEDIITGYNDYHKYATETLAEGGGDCEDTSILFASILSGLDFEVALISLPRHLAIGVKGNFRGAFLPYGNNKYYYCETTGAADWRLGVLPPDYKGKIYQIMPIAPTPVEPKPVKPQVTPTPIEPKPVKPPVDPPKPRPRRETLEKGIKLYEQARYNEAIEALSSAVRELEDPEQRAEAYLYLGGAKRGFGESNEKVKEQFQEAIRHNPGQKLPPRIGQDHPIFAELLEEVRKELTGELTVISLLPQTEIWIYGTGTDRKMLGTGIVSSRHLRGNYIVEGFYAGKSQRKTVTIEPDRHTELNLEIPPDIKHDSPSRISVGEIIPLTLDLTSTKSPQQVTIYYTIYDKDGNELEQNNQKMRLRNQQSASSTWIYKVGLSSQKHVGSIAYYIEIEYDNHLVFRQPRAKNRHYQISIVNEKPPTISPPDLPNVGSENESESESSRIRTPIDSEGNESKSKPGEKPQKEDLTDGDKSKDPTNGDKPKDPRKESSKPDPPISQKIWANYTWLGGFSGVPAASDLIKNSMFRLTYLREGKTQSTLGAQLDFFPDRTNVSATALWGPALGESNIAFTLRGGIAAYKDTSTTNPGEESIHITPILGAGLQLYPVDKIVIDATSSIKLRSDYDTTGLYHYEIGARFYITREVNLRIGYGKLYLGNRNFTTIQVGLGYTF